MASKHSIRFLFIEKTLLRRAYVSVEALPQINVSSQRTGCLGSCPMSDLSLCHICLPKSLEQEKATALTEGWILPAEIPKSSFRSQK